MGGGIIVQITMAGKLITMDGEIKERKATIMDGATISAIMDGEPQTRTQIIMDGKALQVEITGGQYSQL